MNDVREWLARSIHKLAKTLGVKRPRTYKRKARQECLKFAKKKTKTKKTIARTKKAMLQYVRRNLRQMCQLVETAPWLKAKQKERNRIEGAFGNGKQHYGLNRVKYAGEGGTEIWARASLLAMP